MKAITYHEYGDPSVLSVENVAMPQLKAHDLLIRVKAASITTADTFMRKGEPKFGRIMMGLFRPKYPVTGTGFAGIIEQVGSNVTKFKVGDAVFGESVFGQGSHAEFTVVSEKAVVSHLPLGLDFDKAAPICDGVLTSMNFLKKVAQLQPNQHVLINGASGSLGQAAVQIAKYMGATVTAVCSTRNIELVQQLGADRVIDYTKESLFSNEDTYDVIYDTIGKLNFRQCKAHLHSRGQFISPVLKLSILGQMIWTSLFSRKKVKFSATGTLAVPELMPLIDEIRQMYQAQHLTTIIDRRYAFAEIQSAHRYIETGRKKGNLILLPSAS